MIFCTWEIIYIECCFIINNDKNILFHINEWHCDVNNTIKSFAHSLVYKLLNHSVIVEGNESPNKSMIIIIIYLLLIFLTNTSPKYLTYYPAQPKQIKVYINCCFITNNDNNIMCDTSNTYSMI